MRKLRTGGARVNDSCGIHVHVDASAHTAQTLRNIVNIMASKEDLLYKTLRVKPEREEDYCRKADTRFLDDVNRRRPTTIDQLSTQVRQHCTRTGLYARVFAEHIPELLPLYPDLTHDEILNAIHDGAYYHDLGKIMFSPTLLSKPGRLTKTEQMIIKQHPLKTAEILCSDEDFQNNNGETYKKIVLDCGLLHHEHYDGSGYPFGLKGEDIPLAAQIVTFCDEFDALTAYRAYNGTKKFEEAYQIITTENKGDFSELILQRFTEAKEEFSGLYKMKRLRRTNG